VVIEEAQAGAANSGGRTPFRPDTLGCYDWTNMPRTQLRNGYSNEYFETWEKRKACCCASVCHGVALLRGFVTPSLAAQGRQRLPSYFNIQWGNPLLFMSLLASTRTSQ
jgi:hypothetical protein